MSDKPSYLGLLNAIAVAEGQAERYLEAWAEVTPDEEVRRVLRTVALREGEHAKAFEKRICELGFELRPAPEGAADEQMAIASSTRLTDAEKFDRLRVGQSEPDGDDVFTTMFSDPNIDPVTGGLLGRYIAEERDSGRLLHRCCVAVHAAESAESPAAVTDDVLLRLDRIEKLVEDLAARS